MLTTVVAAMIVSASSAAVTLMSFRRSRFRRRAPGIAMCVGAAAGAAVVLRPSSIAPADAHGWLFHLALYFLLFFALPAWPARSGITVAGEIAVSGVVGAVLLFYRVDQGTWTAAHLLGFAAGIGVACTGVARAARGAMAAVGPRPVVLVWAGVIGAAGWAIAWSGFATVAMLAWVLAVVLVVTVCLTIDLEPAQALAIPVAGLSAGYLICACFLASMPPESVAALASGVPGGAVVLCVAGRRRSGRVAAATLVLACTTLGVWLSIPEQRYW